MIAVIVLVGGLTIYYLWLIAHRLYLILLTLKRIENKWWPPTKIKADRNPTDFTVLPP